MELIQRLQTGQPSDDAASVKSTASNADSGRGASDEGDVRQRLLRATGSAGARARACVCVCVCSNCCRNLLFLQCFDTVGWVFRLMKPVPDMTYNVFGGTLKLAHLNSTLETWSFLARCLSLYCLFAIFVVKFWRPAWMSSCFSGSPSVCFILFSCSIYMCFLAQLVK